ncbi:MAG TPA: polysaccharide biosynthesis/export family protein [Acidisoma sp.]|uniref:polysaccharide biosynthesis/export family protein n=1 Tax=Acidisoma sp. TaxID=1872115 RepID=UPI002C5555BA|nr:polysaccharide biosynthesis/export family protein [Acidisoma sp.]HTI01518.1 polysaccharide biosynthesis/export family protein [Acidisoma sp.]
MRARLVLLVLLPLCTCAPAGSSLPPLPPPAQSGTYHLGPGDRVRVVVYGDKELSDVYAIGDDGQIALPLAGTIAVRGRTPEALAQAIAQRLTARGMIRDPSVAVEVASYRPIFILGEVARPGQYPYEPDMTVIAAVSLAGGYTYRAVKGYEAVVRTDVGGTHKGLTKPEDRLAPGDVITIFDRVF